MSINLNLYPNDYPPIEGAEVVSQVMELTKSLYRSSLKNIESHRMVGQMEILTQLLLLKEKQLQTNRFKPVRSRLTQLEIPLDNMGATKIEVLEKIEPLQKKRPAPVSELDRPSERLPFSSTGKSPYPEEYNEIVELLTTVFPKGREGYYIGGQQYSEEQPLLTRGIEKIDFLPESIELTGKNLIEKKKDFAVTGERTGFWVFGGWQENINAMLKSLERLNYLDKSTESVDRHLEQGRAMLTGTSTSYFSYLLGGIVANERILKAVPFTDKIERLEHLSKITTNKGVMHSAYAEGKNSKGSKVKSFLFGALANTWQPMTGISEFNFFVETTSHLGIYLAAPQPWSASVGNEYHVYVIAGNVTQKDGDISFVVPISKVSKLEMVSETLQPFATELEEARSHVGATNTNEAGYIAGGWQAATAGSDSAKISLQSVEKMSPLSVAETFTIMASELKMPTTSSGSISDYGETFYD